MTLQLHKLGLRKHFKILLAVSLKTVSGGEHEFTVSGLLAVIPEVVIRNPATLKTTSLDTGFQFTPYRDAGPV